MEKPNYTNGSARNVKSFLRELLCLLMTMTKKHIISRSCGKERFYLSDRFGHVWAFSPERANRMAACLAAFTEGDFRYAAEPAPERLVCSDAPDALVITNMLYADTIGALAFWKVDKVL